eukprot:14585429-Alexandrium_andersonii.AAC.1
MLHHPRLQELVASGKWFRVSEHLGYFGKECPKAIHIWSNSPLIKHIAGYRTHSTLPSSDG